MAGGEPETAPPPRSNLSPLRSVASILPWLAAGAAFLVLFAAPIEDTVRLWLTDADASHGLLLVPVAVVLAWRRGLVPAGREQPLIGLAMLAAAVLLRYVGGLATERFAMRLSLLLAILGLIVYLRGSRQVVRWWLPASLVLLAMPLPEILLGTLALPLQLQASRLGAWLLETRDVPVRLAGNVIQLPGHRLFVTEACSGLRSMSALLAVGLLIGGLWLKSSWARCALVVAALPVAVLLNGIRIFLTGFAVFYVDPALGEGLMHYSEGVAMFVVALGVLGGLACLLTLMEGSRPQPVPLPS